MSEHGKLWASQFIDEDGAPYGNAYAQFFDSTGVSRKAVWTDRDKTLPSALGTTDDVEGDAEGWISAYGDGLYRIVIRAAGDPGSNTPIRIFEDVSLVDAEPAYDGETDPWTLADEQERRLSGHGRQAEATSAQSGSEIDLSKFDVAGRTYLVEGTVALLTFESMTVEDYEDGARITLECVDNPIKLRAKRAGDVGGENLRIGGDFLMSVGSSIDLELRGDEWYERARFFFDPGYDNMRDTGIASDVEVVVTGKAVKITGGATITNLWWVSDGEMAPPQTQLTLRFTGAAEIVDGGGGGGNVLLNGAFTAQSGTTLMLVSTGLNWIELARSNEEAPETETTLDSGSTPSVAGTHTIYFTGENFDDVDRLTNPTLGRIITIIFNGTLVDSPGGTYTDVRKRMEHQASASEGYVSLVTGADFNALPGDRLTLQCQRDSDDVLYWQEIGRSMIDVAPVIEASGGEFEVWRPIHKIANGTGSTVDIDTISPSPRPGVTVSLVYDGSNNFSFNEDGNLWVASGTEIVMDSLSESFTFMSLGTTGAKNWVQIDAGASTD